MNIMPKLLLQQKNLSFQCIERSFGLLKARFKRLSVLRQKSMRKMIRVVMAACILHNVCIMEKDNITYFLQQAAQM